MKFLIMQFPPVSSHFISLRSKYSSKHPIFNTRDYVLHLYKATNKIIFLIILVFTFLDDRIFNYVVASIARI
jgi:hypothetical protein